MRCPAGVTHIDVGFYNVPTTFDGRPHLESDGTARWDSTGILVIRLTAGDKEGLGYAYTGRAAVAIISDVLASIVMNSDPQDTTRTFWSMAAAVRNLGWPGVSASAISAIDIALHDLKAKLLDASLLKLLGGARSSVSAYGSGGFTRYSDPELVTQLSGRAEDGFAAVKMKIGTHTDIDAARVRIVRDVLGDDTDLFFDANGAYSRKQALGLAELFAESDVTGFEEPVSSDDLTGLHLLRDRAPSGIDIPAGEYGYTPQYFHTMLEAEAVDTLQADATRCGGVTGFVLAAGFAKAAGVRFSAHTAPALHATLGAAVSNAVNVEYFHDHALIEDLFFDGVPALTEGMLTPDPDRAGHGLDYKDADAEAYFTDGWASS